jgi:hypothetical protein
MDLIEFVQVDVVQVSLNSDSGVLPFPDLFCSSCAILTIFALKTLVYMDVTSVVS